MKKSIILYNKIHNKIEYDVLIEFIYDNRNYIVYTDNTVDSNGLFNLYKGYIDDDNNIKDLKDDKLDKIFDRLIIDYKNKVIRGEI